MDKLGKPDTIEFSNTDFSNPDIIKHNPFNITRTRFIVVIANPNVSQVDIQKMMEAGMNAVRLVAGHLTNVDKIRLLKKVNKAAKYLAEKYGIVEWPCATCIDLKTCVVKTGLLEKDQSSIILKENTEVILTYNTAEFDKCNEHQIFLDNPYIISDVTIDMEISIEQDAIILQVKEIGENTVRCVVVKEGLLNNMVTVCLRGAKRSRPYIMKKDLKLVKLAVEYQVEMIFINYVRHVETIKRVKQFIDAKTKRPFIVAGICTMEGLRNLDDIILEADAILLPREMLAYELDRSMSYRMHCIQKWITGKCRQAGKPIFISGQVFYNTLEGDDVDIKDVSDVANAVLEGASGFVLSQCDDIDKLITAMKNLSQVCSEMEPFTNNKIDFYSSLAEMNFPMNAAVATTMSCALLANKSQCRVIVIPTVSGRTVYYLNCMRPIAIILAITTNIKTFRLLQIYRSVVPLLFEGKPRHTWRNTINARTDFAIAYAVHRNWLKYGDPYVTLEKGQENSTFCDTIRSCAVELGNNPACLPDVTLNF